MGYDFESDKNFNYEKKISMSIELEKTCFSKEEYITGFIVLKQKEGIQEYLSEPNAYIKLDEYHHYYLNVGYNDVEAEENYSLVSMEMKFPNFEGSDLSKKIKIPFKVQVPKKAYPTVIFNKSAYVRHYFSIEFPSINAKKTEVIVIKNGLYFSRENKLLLTPAIYLKEIEKSGFISSKGSFSASFKLPINIFEYTRRIPFEINIDCSNLSTNLRKVTVSIHRICKKNLPYDHKKMFAYDEQIIDSKSIPLTGGLSNYHIEDEINFYSNIRYDNPKEVYDFLDKDKRKFSEKFDKILLFPPCYDGLLSCKYYICMELEMGGFFSIPEKFIIPIDFYEPYIGKTPNTPNANSSLRNVNYYNINEVEADVKQEFVTPK